MKQNQLSRILFVLGAGLTLIGSVTKLINLNFAPFVFALGVILIIYLHAQIVFDKSKPEKNQQRLARMGLMNSLFLGIGVYFMFTGSNSWVVMVLIYAMSSFYLSFRGNSAQ